MATAHRISFTGTLIANYAQEEQARIKLNGASPEERSTTLSPQITTPPALEQQMASYGLFPLHSDANVTTTLLPINVLDAVIQSHNIRGQGNTGRDQNIGRAPQDGMGAGFDYFEKIILRPETIALGNVVSEVVFDIELLNTFRRATNTLNDIVNNAGAGITFSGVTTPKSLPPLSTLTAQLVVGTSGPPTINGSIDFETNVRTASVTITGNRIIIFPYVPAGGIKEEMEWLTDVIRAADGTENRHALRTLPRTSVEYDVQLSRVQDINRVQNLLVDWSTRVFGVPLWWDERELSADVAVSDTTVFLTQDPTTGVGGTDFADFRTGGLAMLLQVDEEGNQTLDVLQIQSVSASPASITFTSQIQNAYTVAGRATVVPVVPGIVRGGGLKQRTVRSGEFSAFSSRFSLLENDSVVSAEADARDWPELDDFDGIPTPVIDDKNLIESALDENWTTATLNQDFDTGVQVQLTNELSARRSTPWQIVVETTEYAWQLRRLLHRLKGRLRNVWVPTWRKDFEVTQTIGLLATSLDFKANGFVTFVRDKKPWAGVRILLKDGRVSYHRITGYVEVSAAEERILIAPAVPWAAAVDDIDRVDYLVYSRMADDKVTVIHSWSCPRGCEVDETFQMSFVGDIRA